jgi:hypothetical protein
LVMLAVIRQLAEAERSPVAAIEDEHHCETSSDNRRGVPVESGNSNSGATSPALGTFRMPAVYRHVVAVSP